MEGKSRKDERVEALRMAIGRAFGVGLADVGAWAGEERLWAGFYDPRERRPQSFAAVVDAAGRITWWEELAVGVAA